jgi:hypothetical protein
MTDKHRTERDVDAAIDRAVHEIMSAEPRPGFRRRVLDRLGDAPPARWTWARISVGIAAATASLVAAIWLAAPERSTAPTAPAVARHQPAEVAPPPPSPTRKTEGEPPVVKKPIAPAGPLRTVPRRAVPQPPPGRVEAASLPLPQPNAVSTIELIQLPPLQPIPEVDVRRRIIERITTSPLSPPR